MPPEFAEPLHRAAARRGVMGCRVVWLPEVTSTNDVAAALAEQGADEGSLVVAESQTRGRGRMGRVWASPAGRGVYASLVLRPLRGEAALLTIAAGAALAEAVAAATGLGPALKWPNDLCVGPSGAGGFLKFGGILAEAGSSRTGQAHVVLGFGINVLPAAYPPALAGRATSLEAELGRPVDRGCVLAECLAALSRRYRQLQEGRSSEIVEAWRGRAAATLGRPVEWENQGVVHRGVAEDIDQDGALLVRTAAGVTTVIAGQVRWVS